MIYRIQEYDFTTKKRRARRKLGKNFVPFVSSWFNFPENCRTDNRLLPLRRVITFAVTNLQLFFAVFELDFEFAETAVVRFVLWFEGKQILLAQILFELCECLIEIARMFRDDGATAGRFAKFFEAAGVHSPRARIADADGINHDFG